MKFFKFLQYCLIIAIIGLAVYKLIPYFSDFTKLWKLKDEMKLGWLGLAVFTQLFQYVGDGLFSQLFLNIADIKVRLKDSLRIASLNIFAAHLLPIGEAGGLVAAYHFYRKLGVDTEKFIFLSICWTFIVHVILIILFIIPSFFLPSLTNLINTSVIFIGIMAASIITISLYFSRHHLFSHLEKLFGKNKWAHPFITVYRNRNIFKLRLKQHPFKVFMGLIACLIYYGANIASLTCAFMTLGTLPPIGLMIFAYAASTLFSKITLAPAGIGAAEASFILIFLSSGIQPEIAVGATLIYRVISFWLPIPAGFFSYYSLKKETGKKLTTQDLKQEADILFGEDK